MCVLISTYWNVNDVIIVLAGANDFVLISTYWNVNPKNFSVSPSQAMVLISTYWNVNHELSEACDEEYKSFNLNLLECKCCCSIFERVKKFVLISTYWNVNFRPIRHCLRR